MQNFMKNRKSLLGLCSVVFFSSVLAASAQQLKTEQIQIIKDTAASICNTVKEAKGQKSDVQLQGDVTAQLAGVIGKLVNVGGSGKGSLTREEFEGLSRDATATALEGDRGCRERVFNKMFDKLVTGPQPDREGSSALRNLQGAVDYFGMNKLRLGLGFVGGSAIAQKVEINNEYLRGLYNRYRYAVSLGDDYRYDYVTAFTDANGVLIAFSLTRPNSYMGPLVNRKEELKFQERMGCVLDLPPFVRPLVVRPFRIIFEQFMKRAGRSSIGFHSYNDDSSPTNRVWRGQVTLYGNIKRVHYSDAVHFDEYSVQYKAVQTGALCLKNCPCTIWSELDNEPRTVRGQAIDLTKVTSPEYANEEIWVFPRREGAGALDPSNPIFVPPQ